MKAIIYKPAKAATQSGRGKTGEWILEYELETAREPEPLIGWVSSGDTLNQVRIAFPDQREAIAFAKGRGLDYIVLAQHARRVRPRNYADNFKYVPAEKSAKA